jgi:PST family polysaccharide transporter
MTDDLKAKVVRGVGWSALQSWGMRLISFAVYPVLARILGPETYGLIALAGVYVTLLDIFSDVSFGAAIEQRRDLDPEHLDSVFWAFLGLGIVLTAASVAAAPLVAAFFDEPQLTPVVRWLSLGFLLQMISGVQTSLLRRDLQMRRLAGYNLSATVVGGVLGVGLALTGFGVWSLVVQRLSTRVTTVGLLWGGSSWRPGRRFSRRHLQEMSGFGLPVMGNRLLNYLNRQLDQLLVGRFLGKVALGFYFNASKLQTLATSMLVGSFAQVALPAMSRLQDDRPRFQRAYAKACRYTVLIAFPVFAGMSILAEELIVVVLGPQWQPSAPALRVLALVGLVHAIQYVNGSAMMALGRADLRLGIQIVHSVVNVIGFLVAVPYGFVAVAGAYTARAYLLAPLDLLVNRRLGALSFRTLGRAVRAQAVAVVAMSAVLWWLRSGPLAGAAPATTLAVGVASGAVVYAAVCLILDRALLGECRDLAASLTGRQSPAQESPRP